MNGDAESNLPTQCFLSSEITISDLKEKGLGASNGSSGTLNFCQATCQKFLSLQPQGLLFDIQLLDLFIFVLLQNHLG